MEVEAPFARCRECPLVDRPFVPGNGPPQTDLVVVGQAPGDQEVDEEKPFVGPAGQRLRRGLALLCVDEDKVHFTNTVLCHPGKRRDGRDKKPAARAIAACRERLKREIEGTGAGWILAVGTVAAEGVTGEPVSVSESRCSRLRHPLVPDRLGIDALVGITHHPVAPFPRELLVADICTLLGFRNDGRTPDVYLECGGISTDR